MNLCSSLRVLKEINAVGISMGNIKQINTKNQTSYFYNDMIIENFHPSQEKERQKIIQRYWHLQYWINHNKNY